MKKLLAVLFTSVLVLAGCSSTSSDTASEDNPCDNGDKTITMVTDTGGIHDKSFNQGSWEGIEQFCSDNPDYGAVYIESGDTAQLEQNLETAAEQSQVVLASGFYFESPMYNVAKEYPDTDFILIDGQPLNSKTNKYEELDNVECFSFDETQAGYLAGYVAGEMTKTDHIGFVGGEEIPPVQRYGYGFIQGAQDANPDITIDYQYTGSFSDVSAGNSTAQTMIGQDDDIIFAAAGGTNDGVIKAATSATQNGDETWVIGVDRDEYDDGKYKDDNGKEKSVVLTSAMKNVGQAAQTGLNDALIDDDFKGGTTTLTYQDGGVGLPEKNPNLEGHEDVIKDAEAAMKKADLADNKKDTEKAIKDSVTVNGDL